MKRTVTLKGAVGLPFIVVNDEVIVEINQAFADMIEFSIEDFLYKSTKDLFEILRIGPNFSDENIDETFEYFLFTKSLEVKVINISVTEDSDRKTYFFQEKVNSRLEDKFCYLYPQITENLAGIFIYSVPDFTLLKASQMALDSLDTQYNTPENTYGKPVYEIISGWKDSYFEFVWKEIIITGNPRYFKGSQNDGFERGTTYWDTTLTPIKESGKVKYIVINSQEVTERVVNQKRLEEQNKTIKFQKQQLETIINGLSDYITLIDKNGNFVKQDKIIEQSGLDMANIFDKPDHDCTYYDLDGNMIPQEETPIYRVYGGEEVEETKLRVVIDGKKEVYLIGKGKPIYDENGEVLIYIVISQDITEWIEKEKLIKHQKAQLEAAIDSMNESVAIYDETGNAIHINSKARKEHPFIPFNISSFNDERRFFDVEDNLIPFDSLPASRVMRGEKVSNEKIIYKFDDKNVILEVNAVPVLDSENNFLSAVVTHHDISKIMGYEKELTKQKEQLEVELSDAKLLQSISMELLLQDDVQVLYEKIIDAAMKIMDSEYASIQMLHLENHSSNKLQLLAFRGFNPEAAEFWEWVHVESGSTCGEALRTGQRVIVPNVNKCPFIEGTEDQTVYLNTGINSVQTTPLYSRSGRMVGMISTHWRECYNPSERQLRLLDVVARQAADLIVQKLDAERLREGEENLRKQKELLEAVIENMNDALFIMNPDGSYIYNNKRAYDMGFNAEKANECRESIEHTKYYYLDGKDLSIDDMPSSRILKGEKIDNVIVKSISPDKIKYLSLNGCPIYDISGDMVSAIVCIRDMTDYIENVETLNENQLKLVQVEREKNEALEKVIEMKDDFLSLISHEFRTPINVINTAIQTMNFICKDDLTDRTQKYINIIRQNTFRQLRLVNNLLDITRSDAGRIKIHKRNIDLVFLTNSIVESVYTYASQKGVAVIFASTIESKIIGIDDEKYERILLNLLSNAIKFTPVGKLITVKLRATKNKVCVEVKDNGIGIPEDKLDVIFDRFGQVDSSLSRQAEGAGIGLSLVKRFVEALNGDISVKSKVGKGSTFKIILPDEQVIEETNIETSADLMDNRLIQTTTVEFSDIYL
ncbi:hypothetical protein CSC2_07550 [Clostridium zeae]|uniref:histidine kinase n=1 Tax=Clostridium zeae TaxID=2759022 RepID=A0ABQ1E647_9CLOT|nr:ATP-binding protein [Clostridium zeae]GFZ30229.1 hypothetical protein CSC2_07550 [Clostridium zeae]